MQYASEYERRTHELNQLVLDNGLVFEQCSPIESASYIGVPPIAFARIARYTWPKKNSGHRYDTAIYIGIYDDGSYTLLSPLKRTDRIIERKLAE